MGERISRLAALTAPGLEGLGFGRDDGADLGWSAWNATMSKTLMGELQMFDAGEWLLVVQRLVGS